MQDELLNKNIEPSEEKESIVEEVPARDARVRVFRSADLMSAQVMIEEPQGAGKLAERADIDLALKKEGVLQGINEEGILKLLLPTYDMQIPVAFGAATVDGVDGIVTDHFSRNHEAKLSEREDGTVNYKELGLIRDIPEGTKICDVTEPVVGADGVNVLGQPLKARVGKKPSVPIGEGTRISTDGKNVVAITSGNLVFRAGKFCVDKVYRVQNVDYDIGNITFSGDVIVNGDMQDGFEIHSGGDVTLRGRVGGVKITAAGNLNIDTGINGTGTAVLEVSKILKASFIENCTLRVGEKIIAKSIINSTIECEGDVEVTGGRGMICGGKITVFGSVKANEVGNESNTLTVITLGVTPRLLKERKRLNEQLGDVTRHLEEMVKNINYIERLVEDGRPVPSDRVQILQRTKIQKPMSEKKQAQLKEKLAELDEKMASVNNASLTARIIHPPTKISIGAMSTNCIETRNSCRVYRSSAGEIVFGSSL